MKIIYSFMKYCTLKGAIFFLLDSTITIGNELFPDEKNFNGNFRKKYIINNQIADFNIIISK